MPQRFSVGTTSAPLFPILAGLVLVLARALENPKEQTDKCVPACPGVSSSGGRCLKKQQIKLKIFKHNVVQSVDMSWKSCAKTR